MGDVFISYKQEERERMRPIADGLRELGVDIWFDERLQPDRSFTEEIQGLIHGCRAQLVCWSPAAVASEWVRGEAEKGRQRGVLVAVMIEQCDLPPPFNMHHAENLVGWTGDTRHNGWRKVCDAIGRKIDRPGLGELAAASGSNDAAAWKKWAQKFPNDPFADTAWAKAEELEIGAARERMAKERDGAKRAAEEAERRRAAASATVSAAAPAAPRAQPQPAPHSEPSRGGMNPMVLVGGLAVAAAVAAGLYFLLTQRGATTEAAESEVCQQLEQSWTEVRYSAERADVQSYLDRASVDGCSVHTDIERRLASMPSAASGGAEPTIEAPPTDGAPPVQQQASRTTPGQERTPASDPAASLSAEEQFRLGQNYRDGRDGLTQNYTEAVRLFRLAAGRGHAGAQSDLGRMYETGRGVTQNHSEAARYFRMSANQGYSLGQFNLGVSYETGEGVQRDDAEAARLYQLAANQGYMRAQYNLGVMYSEGRGVARNDVESVRLYRLAAAQDYAEAQYALGYMYENGFGVTANVEEAVRWYQLAARQNFREAQNQLNRLGRTW